MNLRDIADLLSIILRVRRGLKKSIISELLEDSERVIDQDH